MKLYSQLKTFSLKKLLETVKTFSLKKLLETMRSISKRNLKYIIILYTLNVLNLSGLLFFMCYKLDIPYFYLFVYLTVYGQKRLFNCEDINNLINLYVFDPDLLIFIRIAFSILICTIKLKENKKWVFLILINNLKASYLFLVLKEESLDFVVYLLLLRNLLINKFYLINDTNLNFVGWLDCLITLFVAL